jgi:hypothetical protein
MFSSDAEICAIGEALLARTLPKPAWTHPAHFAAAVWLIRCRPDLRAKPVMPGIIRAYNAATGVANTPTGGYHETITQASIGAASHHITAHPHAALHGTVRSTRCWPARAATRIGCWPTGREQPCSRRTRARPGCRRTSLPCPSRFDSTAPPGPVGPTPW